jgi:hypothetical protein
VNLIDLTNLKCQLGLNIKKSGSFWKAIFLFQLVEISDKSNMFSDYFLWVTRK